LYYIAWRQQKKQILYDFNLLLFSINFLLLI
jgi:hypothetical protein